MEKRTKIIIVGILLFVVGVPLLFYIQLVRGFGSSAGDYYKISNASIKPALICIDSTSIIQLKNMKLKDSLSETAFFIDFDTDYYSSNINANSSLNAAHAPGREGSKELIDSIELFTIDPNTNQRINISKQIKLPTKLKFPVMEKNPASYYEMEIDTAGSMVFIFEDLEDLKYRYNATRGKLFKWYLEATPLLFFLKHDFADTLDVDNKLSLLIKLNDGTVINCNSK